MCQHMRQQNSNEAITRSRANTEKHKTWSNIEFYSVLSRPPGSYCGRMWKHSHLSPHMQRQLSERFHAYSIREMCNKCKEIYYACDCSNALGVWLRMQRIFVGNSFDLQKCLQLIYARHIKGEMHQQRNAYERDKSLSSVCSMSGNRKSVELIMSHTGTR